MPAGGLEAGLSTDVDGHVSPLSFESPAHVFPTARMSLAPVAAVGSATAPPLFALVTELRKSENGTELRAEETVRAETAVAGSVGLYGASRGAGGSPAMPSSNSSFGSTASIRERVAGWPRTSGTRFPETEPECEPGSALAVRAWCPDAPPAAAVAPANTRSAAARTTPRPCMTDRTTAGRPGAR